MPSRLREREYVTGLIMGRTQKYFSARQMWLGKMNGFYAQLYNSQFEVA